MQLACAKQKCMYMVENPEKKKKRDHLEGLGVEGQVLLM
jgi:hypothetical protein